MSVMGILEIKDVYKSFGGLMAIECVSMDIQEQEVCSIIGPNGAGKTTLFNVISGRFPPDDGHVSFQGMDITGKPAHRIVSMGIGRTFQITNIFPLLTAFENIQAAVIKNRNKSFTFFRSAKRIQGIQDETWQILKEIELSDQAEVISGHMPYGDQRRLEIGIALANRPSLLLLDEPTAGMSPEETRSTVRLIERLIKERKMTLLVIEHDMDVVFSISDRIYVLHQGALIAEGSPEEVAKNQDVISAYLGE
jgi:branched-chain amino acid transport system ATP-binding protein